MEFAKRLQKCLALRGINANQLSIKTGVTKSSISLYLQGKRNPKTSQIIKMAEVLRVDATYLMGLTDDMVAPVMKPSNSLLVDDTEKRALLNEIMSVCSFEDESNLKTILDVVKTLARKNK